MNRSRGAADPSRGEKAKRRSYNARLIKRLSYTIREIADLFGIHPQAARRWIKADLRTIDGDLIDFLSERRSSRKQTCGPNQFFWLITLGWHRPRFVGLALKQRPASRGDDAWRERIHLTAIHFPHAALG
jgi:hypothetical protein